MVSLETLRREYSPAYFLMCGLLAPRELSLHFDEEVVSLKFSPSQAALLTKPEAAAVRLWTTRQTIIEIIDAQQSLHEAVESNAITLIGPVDDLASFHEGLLVYIRGAVRCPSFPPLLDRFRLTISTS